MSMSALVAAVLSNESLRLRVAFPLVLSPIPDYLHPA